MPINRTDAELDKFLEVAPNESAVRVMITESGTKPDNRTDLERNKFVVDGNGDTAVRVVIAGGATETITTLVDNGDGTFSYTSEDGTVTTISLTVDVNVQGLSYDQTTKQITLTETDGSTHVIDVSDLVDAETVTTLVDNGNGSFTYTNEAGTSVTFFSSEFLTSITNTVTGHKIADYTDEEGTVKAINETVTAYKDLSLEPHQIGEYYDENGDTVKVNENLTKISQPNGAGELITYTNEEGVSVSVNPDGSGVIATTRTNLISLRDSSNLDLRKIYTIPLSQQVGGNTGVAYIKPIDKDKLPSSIGWYFEDLTGQNTWVAHYDIDADDLSYIKDPDFNNDVWGETSIAVFPFGVSSVSDTQIRNGIVNYTAGTINNLNLNNSTVAIESGSILNANISEGSNYTHKKGIHREFTIAGDSDVTYDSASDSYENYFGNSVNVNHSPVTGSPYIRYSRFTHNSTIQNLGNVNFANSETSYSEITTTGSVGNISGSSLHRIIASNIQNIPSLTINDCNFSNYTQLSANGAVRLYLYRCSSDAGRFMASAGTTLNCSYSSASTNGYFQSKRGTLTANYSNASSYGYIENQSTGSNRAERCDISSSSRVRFLNTSNNCRVYYSKASASGVIEHRGSSSNSYIYYSEASANSYIYTNNDTNARLYYCTSHANSRVYCQGNTVTHYMYYCSGVSNGNIQMVNNTASVRMYAVNATGRAIARVQNSAVAANLYYSTFSAYYYAYITFTASMTRSALHGYGRRSYTVTNPVNGTYEQNF